MRAYSDGGILHKISKKPILVSAEFVRFYPLSLSGAVSRQLGSYELVPTCPRRSAQLDIGLAISETTKTDAERLLKAPGQRIVNIQGSVDERFRILPEAERQKTGVRDRLGLNQIIYPLCWRARPSKKTLMASCRPSHCYGANIRRHVSSYWSTMSRMSKSPLIAQQRAPTRHPSDIVISGFVSDDELVELYNACELFVFPSLYEGLGLPVIEAMRCGAPVLVRRQFKPAGARR